MLVQMFRSRIYIVAFFSFLLAVCACQKAFAQNVDSLVVKGDSLREVYCFEESSDIYGEALSIVTDTASIYHSDTLMINKIRSRLLLSENGRNMSRFVQKPEVIAKRRFSLEDFFLYYPLENGSWRALPNQLDSSVNDPLSKALYAPDWDNRLFFSAPDESGSRDIFVTLQRDTIWTFPEGLGFQSAAESSEIYPMLSPDRKTLYFSSNGFYGVGGYDLYASTWDEAEGKWSAPQNMGFPFSSPADDFLYMDSEDGQYSIFASNRECSKDSVWVYVFSQERYPVHVPVTDPDELVALSRMAPPVMETARQQEEQSMDNHLTSAYMDKMTEIRILRDSIAVTSSMLDAMRTEFAFSNDAEDRMQLTDKILSMETDIPVLQRELDRANRELRDIEMDFLKEGIFIDMDVSEEEDSTNDDELPEYVFTKMEMGAPLKMNIEVPVILFDYGFRILDEAQFAEDQQIPGGIIYQIQLFSGSRKALPQDLKGLSPIYEHRSPNGMYIYRVGRFMRYDEALQCLYKVRPRGFADAFIVAFDDRREVSVAAARAVEAKSRNEMLMYEVRIIPESGEIESALMSEIVVRAIGKDVARIETSDGTQIYIVGPFDSSVQAEELASFIRSQGVGNVSCELTGSELKTN